MKFLKLRTLLLAAVASGLAYTATAKAAEDTQPINAGPYIALGVGANLPYNEGGIISGAPTPKLEWHTGFLANGAIGYKMDSGLRLELETGWRRAALDHIQGDTNNVGGHEGTWDVTGDVLYDFNLGRVQPYVGGGIGFGRIQFDNVQDGIAGDPIFNGHDTKFEWQGIAGLNFPLSNRLSFYVEYRYISLNRNDINSRDNAVTLVHYDDHSSNILGGVRFALGAVKEAKAAETSSAPPPPAPPPERAAAPPPPPVPEKVIAFFDFDKSNLRPDAKQIVQEAASYAKGHSVTVIHVTGYTDTMGTSEYNMALSKRRAETVKAELVHLGIPASEIEVAWKGKTDLLKPTGDQVREPQNRRVEIIYD